MTLHGFTIDAQHLLIPDTARNSMTRSITKEQVFKDFSEGKVGYLRAMSLLHYDNYDTFLTDVFNAGYDYPRASEEDVMQAVKDYNELFGENVKYVPPSEMSKK